MRQSQKRNSFIVSLLVISMEDTIIQKAALQALCDHLGFDEGIVYFDILNKKDYSKKYSHSKTYRILQSLQDSGAISKVVKEEKENAVYVPLPPSFLYNSEEKNIKKIIEYLEKLYLANYSDLFMNNYLEIDFRYTQQIQLFLIKYYMEDYAIMVTGGNQEIHKYKENIPKEKLDKVTFICRRDYLTFDDPIVRAVEPHLIGNKRVFIADGKILVEVIRFPNENPVQNPNKTKFSGYILSKKMIVKTKYGDKDYIKMTEDEIRKLLNIPK